MALESSRRTSIRYDYDNAGGDHHLSKESYLDVKMVERESVVGYSNQNQQRYLGGLVGNKEIFSMMSIAVAAYLINGEWAQVVCTALTSVPPAVFSYRVLTNLQTTKEGYHTILFYWTLYGLFTLADQFVATAQGYNLVKGGLLGFVFLHAVRSNWSALPGSWKSIDPNSADLITSLFTRVFEESGSGLGSTVAFDPRTPTITHFSDDDSEFMFPLESSSADDNDVSTAFSFTKSPEMQSTQKVTASSKHLERLQFDDSSPAIQHQKLRTNHFESMSAMTRTGGGPSDIITVPSDRITFSADNREGVIQVTNISPSHVMFALKTNADTYLVAAPTTGVLLSGQTMTMRVGVNETFFQEHFNIGAFADKLAIDYAPIPSSLTSSATKFSLPFFQSQNRRRHAIRVFYQ